jgi:hypothetical protein
MKLVSENVISGLKGRVQGASLGSSFVARELRIQYSRAICEVISQGPYRSLAACAPLRLDKMDPVLGADVHNPLHIGAAGFRELIRATAKELLKSAR